jgi:prepilin signal peptidase PulO-like enzyme (type II secretory pathway)
MDILNYVALISVLVAGIALIFGLNRVFNHELNGAIPAKRIKKFVLLGVILFISAFVFCLTSAKFEMGDSNRILNLLSFVVTIITFTTLIYLAVFDFVTFEIPMDATYLALGGVILMRLLDILARKGEFINYLLTGVILGGVVYLVVKLSKESLIGSGDIYIALIAGLLLGFPKIIVAFYITIFAACFYGILTAIYKKRIKGVKIPFVPFIVIGILSVYLIQIDLIAAYASLFEIYY